MLQKLNAPKGGPAAAKKKGAELLDLSIPPPSYESGYSTWIEGSSVDTISEASSLKNVLSLDQAEQFFAGENSFIGDVNNLPDAKSTQIIQAALAGQNLLGMMEEPKQKFNNTRNFSGSDSLDLFIDPIAIFGSDRHPALQEVLQQLDLCKRNRGDSRPGFRRSILFFCRHHFPLPLNVYLMSFVSLSTDVTFFDCSFYL